MSFATPKTRRRPATPTSGRVAAPAHRSPTSARGGGQPEGPRARRRRAVTPKRAGRTARSTPASRSRSAHERTRALAGPGGSDVALHLSSEERRERERRAILHSMQQAMHSKRQVFGHTIEDPKHVFAAFDRDASGTLSPDELFQALKRLGLGLSDEQLGRLAAFLDVDGDGEIDYGELLGFLDDSGRSERPLSPSPRSLPRSSPRSSPRSPPARQSSASIPVAQSPWRVQLAQRAVEESDAEERRVAASKVQAQWRGGKTRRAIQEGNWDALPVDWLAEELAYREEPPPDLAPVDSAGGQWAAPPDLVTVGANGGWEAAETIQRTYRGHHGRRRVQHIKDTTAATHIQRVHRGRQQRAARQREHWSATRIQQHHRGTQGRKAARRKLERDTHASRTIQRVHRGHRGRQRYRTTLLEARREELSATRIQATYRGHHDRSRIAQLAHPPAWQEREEQRAAVKVQAFARSSRVQRHLASPECIELREFLQSAGLARFFASMFENGIGSIAEMDALSRDDLLRLGMQRKDLKKLQYHRFLKGPDNAQLRKVRGAKQAEQDEENRRKAQAAAVGVGKAAAQAARTKVLQEEAVQEQEAAIAERDGLLHEGDAQINGEHWKAAIESFTRFIAHPQVGEVDYATVAYAYHRRGHCLQMVDNAEAAEDDYTAGIAIAGDQGYALCYHRARLRIGLGDIDGAREDLDRASSIQAKRGPLGPSAVFAELEVPKVSIVTLHCPAGVHGGETIAVDLGDDEIEVVVPEGLGPGDEWDIELEEAPASDSWEPAKLTLADDTDSGWSYSIKDVVGDTTDVVIGRAVQQRSSKTARGPADCLLDGGDMTIARRHAKITATRYLQQDPQTPELVCEISCFEPNFVHVNGELVRGSASRELAEGDEITIGSTKLQFTPGSWKVSQPTASSIQDLLRLCDKVEEDEVETTAATKIQARVRGKQTRHHAKKAADFAAQTALEEKAAITIQARARGQQVRLEMLQESEQLLESAEYFDRLEQDAGSWLRSHGAGDIATAVVTQFECRTVRDLMFIIRERDDWSVFLPEQQTRWDGLWTHMAEEHKAMKELTGHNSWESDLSPNEESALSLELEAEATPDGAVDREPAPEPAWKAKKVVFGKPGPLGLTLQTNDPLDTVWQKKARSFDKDGDGELNREEVAEVLAGLGRPTEPQDVDIVFREMDTDNDGSVNIQEFEDWYKLQDHGTKPGELKPPVKVQSVQGLAAKRGLTPGLHILSIQGPDKVRHDMRDATLREVNERIKTSGRPLTMEFTPANADIQQYSSPRGQLHRERKEQSLGALSLAKSRGPAFKMAIQQQMESATKVTSAHPEADATTEAPAAPRAKSPAQTRRFPSKPRVERKPPKAKLSAVTAFMAAGAKHSAPKPAGEIVNKAAAVSEHYRAAQRHAELVAEAEKRADSDYYLIDADAKVAEQHDALKAELEQEIEHQRQHIAEAEAELRGNAQDPAAAADLQQEQEHLHDLEETLELTTHVSDDDYAQEVEAEMEAAMQAHAEEIAAAAAAVEAARLAIGANEKTEPPEDEPLEKKKRTQPGEAHSVDDEGYVMVTVPDGAQSHMEIVLTGGRKAHVEIPQGLSPGEEFEAYVGAIPEEEPAAKPAAPIPRGGSGRRRPRTPGTTKQRRVLSCGASPRTAGTPPEQRVRQPVPEEPDHQAAVAAFLTERHNREHSPREMVEEAEPPLQPEPEPEPEPSLSLSPVRSSARKPAFNLSRALTAGLSGLESSRGTVTPTSYGGSSARLLSSQPPQPQPAARGGFNATGRMNATASSASPQWLAPTSSAASVATTAGWGATPVTATSATVPANRGGAQALGAAWGQAQRRAEQEKRNATARGATRPVGIDPAIEAAFRPRSSRGIAGGVDRSTSQVKTPQGVRRFAPQQKSQTTQQQQQQQQQQEERQQERPGSPEQGRRSPRGDRKSHPNSFMSEKEREKQRRKLEAEKRAREQYWDRHDGAR